MVAQIEAKVGRHLVVAATTRAQLSAEDTDALEQAPLQCGVDVLVIRRRSEDPVPRIVVELVERGEHPAELVGVEQPGPGQDARVCAGPGDVVRRQPPVELHAHG